MLRYTLLLLLSVLLLSCNSGGNGPKKKRKKVYTKASYTTNVRAIVSIQTFDHYTRRLKQGYGFYISKDIVVTNLDLIKGCYKARIAPMNTDEYTDIRGFVAYSFNYNLVLLKTQYKNLKYLKLKNSETEADSVYSLFRKNKKPTRSASTAIKR